MADLDIFGVKPHKVSRDMKGYCVTFYGEPKTGKTTAATRFPNHLLLAFEKGYSAIPGAMALPINSWAEFKKILKQLDKSEAKDTYETIIVDTGDIAYEYCEKFICNQNGVQSISDIPFGGGYSKVEKEFDSALRSIMQKDYGLVMISHSTDKTFKDENGEEFQQIVTTLDKRANKIITRMSDIIGYSRLVKDEDDNDEIVLFMRGTSRFVAGSRFKDTPDYIPFTYDALVNAIGNAVDSLEKEFGSESVTDVKTELYKEVVIEASLEDLQSDFGKLAASLMDEDSSYWGPRIVDVVEQTMGTGAKIADATPAQKDLVDLALDSLKSLASAN